MEVGVRDPWNPGEAFLPECPLCSGKVARNDPAAQALDWALTQSEGQPWGIHGRLAAVTDALVAPEIAGEAADALREFASVVTRPARDRAFIAERQRILDLYANEGYVMWEGEDREPEKGPGEAGEEEEEPDGPDTGGIEDEPGLRHGDPPGDDEIISVPTDTCCLLAFEYPLGDVETIEEWGKRFHQGDRAETRDGPWVGFRFQVLALFKNSGTDPKTGRRCRCKCCRFVQRVDGERTLQNHYPATDGTLGPASGTPQTTKKSGQDCTVVTEAGGVQRKVCYGKGDPALAHSDESSGVSHEYINNESGDVSASEPEIPGLQAAIDSALEKYNNSHPGEQKETRKTVCVYYMQDKPGMELDFMDHARYNMCFTGQIWNKCPSWRKKQEEKFRLYLSGYCGYVSTSGKEFTMHWDPNPKGTPRSIADCGNP